MDQTANYTSENVGPKRGMAGRRTALHHVELCVRDGPSTVAYFSQRLHFSVWARRDTPAARQWVVRSRRSVFVVTQKRETDESQPCVQPNSTAFPTIFVPPTHFNHPSDQLSILEPLIPPVKDCVITNYL